MEKVSIIIPAYNDAAYLEACLESILHQDYSDIEIIVINDGSTDDTQQILSKFQDRLLVISKKNEGPSIARNLGLQYATGEYVMFVDADDIVSQQIVSVLVDAIQKEKYDLAICGQYSFLDNGKIVKQIEGMNQRVISNRAIFTEIRPYFNTYMTNPPYGRLYRTSVIKDNQISFHADLSLGEDFIFNLNYYSVIDRCIFVKGCLYGCRKSGNYLTKRYSGPFMKNKGRMFVEARKILRKKGVSEEFLNGQLIIIAVSYLLEIQNRLPEVSLTRKKQIIAEFLELDLINEALQHYTGGIKIKILGKVLKRKNVIFIYMILKGINLIRS